METMYIVRSLGYWGRGATEAEAMAQWKKAGGRFRCRYSSTCVYRITYEAGKDKPFIDGSGCLNYYGESVQVAEYSQNGKRKALVEA